MTFVLALSTLENVLELIGFLVIFFLILAAAYFVSRWVGNNQSLLGQKCKNISVVETFRLTPNKVISIVRLGDKYVAVAISKDKVDFLTEISEEALSLPEEVGQSASGIDFKEILSRINKKTK
jgi:flagellar protein FliO/FliZ